MPEAWQPKFFVLNNGDLKSGLTAPFWQQLLQTQSYAGESFRLRNFIQPTFLTAAYHFDATTVQPAMVTAVDTANSNIALLTESDRIASFSAPTAASVGVATGAVVSAKTNRRYLLLTNTSANTISLAFGQNAVLNSGITLAAGAAYEMTSAAGNLHDLEVQAIASVAASNLAIQEA